MGMDSSVELKVRAFNDAAKQRVLDIDLSEHNLVNWTDAGKMLICNDSDLAAGRNELDGLMEKIAAALNGEGMAYVYEAVDEDVPYGITYYYLGNRVRERSYEWDIDEAYMDEEGEYMDPWDAAKRLHESYIPTAKWAKKEKLTKEEADLLKKYPW